jgi:hypothetical protein
MTPAGATRARRLGWRSYLLLLVLAAGAVMALWSWVTLTFYYSEGNRAGLLQKFSRKGYFCRTQEGELVLSLNFQPGVSPPIWLFSVRDRKVGDELDQAVGSWVELHYTEHPGIPSRCFGDTRYFVDRVTIRPMPYGPQPGPAPSAAPPAAVPPVIAPPAAAPPAVAPPAAMPPSAPGG